MRERWGKKGEGDGERVGGMDWEGVRGCQLEGSRRRREMD